MEDFKRILLVEDDKRDIELTLNTLAEYNLSHEIVVAYDGVEALDYLYRRGNFAERPEGNPSVIFLDLKMPRMDGINLLRRIKSDEMMKHIPIVVMTSSLEEQDREECYKLGINAYVVKPVRFEEFIDSVRKTGVFWAFINEPPPAGKREG
jgi:CheY-like chemotaxis protein